MTSITLKTIASACGVAAISGVVLLALPPDSEARPAATAETNKSAAESPVAARNKTRTMVKKCGAGFSYYEEEHPYYLCSTPLEHYCPSGYVKSELIFSDNKAEYRCALGPN